MSRHIGSGATGRAWPADVFRPTGSTTDRLLDRLVYIHSAVLDPRTLICDDAGPGYASTLAIATDDVDQLDEHADDDRVLILCNRLTSDEWKRVVAFKRRRGDAKVVVKIVDPYYPRRPLFDVYEELATQENTAFMSVYEAKETVADFFDQLDRIGRPWGVVPYPYLRSREVERAPEDRRNQVLLSGAMDEAVYPLRTSLRDRRRRSVPLRRKVAVLAHPGYPDIGQRTRHRTIGMSFVTELSRYRFMFLCPTRAGVELMKYAECAYAGCVPVGVAPTSFGQDLVAPFVVAQPDRIEESIDVALGLSAKEAADRARAYRVAIRAERSRESIRNRLAALVGAAFPS